jgi:hypothetical protein
LCKIAGFNGILIYFQKERPWTGSITYGLDAPWTGPEHTVDVHRSAAGRAIQLTGGHRRWSGRRRGPRGVVLVLTEEREATETAGDEREQEAAVAIRVERLRARR